MAKGDDGECSPPFAEGFMPIPGFDASYTLRKQADRGNGILVRW